MLRADAEGREEQDEDEEVVRTQRVFDQVAAEELKSGLRTAQPPQRGTEAEAEADPQRHPAHGLWLRRGLRLAATHREVDGQHHQRPAGERRPG